MPKKKRITITPEAIKRYLADYGGDGHAILDPENLLFYGFPEEFLSRLEETFESAQGVYLTDGLKKARGIPNLRLLSAIAAYLGDKSASPAIGRGTQARFYTEAIEKALAA